MPSIGLSMGRVHVRAASANQNTAPVLTWTSGSSDSTPEFDCDLTNPIVGDIITLQYSSSPSFTSPTTLTNTVDAGEMSALQVSFATGTLSDGTYYFRAMHNNSPWSNAETVTIASSVGQAIGLLLILTKAA